MPYVAVKPMQVTAEQIAALPDAERETYALHVRGIPSVEIAKLTGRSLANVRVTLSHARHRLGVILRTGRLPQRKLNAEAKADAAKMEARLRGEPTCVRCLIHGHIVGDPELCLPTARRLAEQRFA